MEGRNEEPRRDARTGKRSTRAVEHTFPRPDGKTIPFRRPRLTQRLVRYFERAWARDVVARRPEFATIRVLENTGAMESYLNRHFRKSEQVYSEDEIRGLIDAFCQAVVRGDARVKKEGGQSAWQCFTGAWGRYDLRPEDPYAAYRG